MWLWGYSRVPQICTLMNNSQGKQPSLVTPLLDKRFEDFNVRITTNLLSTEAGRSQSIHIWHGSTVLCGPRPATSLPTVLQGLVIGSAYRRLCGFGVALPTTLSISVKEPLFGCLFLWLTSVFWPVSEYYILHPRFQGRIDLTFQLSSKLIHGKYPTREAYSCARCSSLIMITSSIALSIQLS